MKPQQLWALIGVGLLGVGLVTGRPATMPQPDLAVAIAFALCLVLELGAVRVPTFGFFSTGFSLALALACGRPDLQWYALILTVLALGLRTLGRQGSLASALADAVPACASLTALHLFEAWQSRCLAGIVVHFLLAELCQTQLARAEDPNRWLSYQTTREWMALYRWSVLFFAPILVCLNFYQPVYALLGLPMLMGIQRAAYSEMARLRLLDQEMLLRQEAQSRLALAQTQQQLDQATHYLKFQKYCETLLLELTRSLSLSQDVDSTARAALESLKSRIRFRQLAVFVLSQQRLRPLFWLGDSRPPQLSPSDERALLLGHPVKEPMLAFSLEGEGALVVDAQGLPPLTAEEVYLVNLVASQTALGLQSARRYREQQQAQAGMLTASKMAAVGQLAAGVAHELNTPLGAVMLQIELAQIQPGLSANTQKALEVAQKAVEHAQSIISRLLYYSREGAAERQLTDLNDIVHDTLQLIHRQLDIEGVKLETELAPSCPARVNANEIQQVLTNLILNARDACLEAGARGRLVKVRTVVLPRGVGLEVLARGAGVPEAIRERIFEPFFTSKPVGKGVGLGLSVSQELVQQHGGKLTVETPGEPWVTAFRLYLPGPT